MRRFNPARVLNIMASLETVVVETRANPKRSVIWLHGLGADGHDFEPVVPQLGLTTEGGVRFVFPHAPVRPVTLNSGMPMRAWFDIFSLDRQSAPDHDGIAQSAAQIEALIGVELAAGRSASDIVLAGFSQGGAIALQVALHYPLRLAGVMGLSTYLPAARETLAAASSANRNIPVFLAHGRADPVLPFDYGVEVRDALQNADYPVTWREYSMAHQVCMDELRDIGAWLSRIIP